MIHYILQIIIFQLLFLVVYDLFLKKELYFNWNRIYLLVTPILSFVLPFVKIDLIRQNIPEAYIIQLPEVILGASSSNEMARITLDEIFISGTSSLSTEAVFLLIWVLGMLISLGIFSYKLIKINRLKLAGTSTKINKTILVSLPKTNKSFSFLNTIFLGEELSEKQKETILLHEKIHIQEKHSFDLLFFEAIKIICWFNPLVYVFQSKMTLLQEYIADEKAASEKGKNNYYQGLLSQVFNTESIPFINTFFNHSLIKKRIIMLQKSNTKSRNRKINQLKYLMLIPIIGVMLIYTSCAQEPENVEASSVSEKIMELKTVIEKEGITEEEKQEFLNYLHQLSEQDRKDMINGTYKNDTYKKEDAIPFSTIDKVPTYPGCIGTNGELKKCMTKNITQFVAKEFNIESTSNLGLSGKQRISVQFKIDKSGNVVNVRARAPHPSLEAEAIRVVSKLPKMIPGEQDGKSVGVLYSLPILFKIEE